MERMEEEIILVDDEAVCKRQRREDVGFLSSCFMDVVNYDEIIDNWLSEEISLFGSDSTLTPPEEVSSYHETKNKKKKRSFSHINNISKDPTKIRIPPILKSDIRKKYPIMFINMLNLCDIELIELFFKKYTNQSPVLSKYIRFGPKTGNRPTIEDKKEINQQEMMKKNLQDVCLKDFNDVINFVILLTVLVPDRCVRMKRSEVITRSDTLSTVVNIYFELHGTRISHWTPIDAGKFLFSLKDRHLISREDLAEQFQASMPRMESLVPLHVEGKFTLNIENCREDLRISNITSDSVTLAY